MAGTTYNVQPMPPDPASTDWLEVPPLRIGVEYRKVDPEALEATYGDSAADMAEIIERSAEIMLGCYAVGKEPPVLPDDVVANMRRMRDVVA